MVRVVISTCACILAVQSSILLWAAEKMAESENPTIRRMSAELSCAVCHELFDAPKTLICLHTFCAKCLERSEVARRHLRSAARGDNTDRIECPVCSEGTVVSGGAKGITTNFVYVKLVEHLHIHEKLTSGHPLECGKCMQNTGEGRNLSVSFCYDCQAPLCEFCQRMHRQTADLATHHISSLEEIRQVDLPPLMSSSGNSASHSDDVLYVCSKHREPLRLYCFTCNEVICRDCTITQKDHRDHSFEFISEVIENERAGLLECLEPLSEMKEKITRCSNKVRAFEVELEKRQLSKKQKIDQAVGEGMKLLEMRREKLQGSLQKVHVIKHKNVDLKLEEIAMVKGSVDSAIEFTKTTVEKGSDVEVMMYKKEIIARSATLKEMLNGSYDTFEAEADSMDFVYDLSPVKEFGKLCETPSADVSTADGEGLYCPMQDENTTFTVQAKDGKGQPLLHGGSMCSAHISITPAPTGQLETVLNSVVDNQDGSYTVSYRPCFPGVHRVAIKFDEQEICGSPYKANVVRNYTRPIGAPHAFSLPNASPWGVAMVSDTEMVVTASDCIVHVYNINGTEVDSIQSNFTRPYGVSTDHKGHLWITDREAHTVQKFYRNDKGEFVKIFQFGSRGINAGQFSHPRGIAVNPVSDFIYISDMKNNRIQIFKPESPVPRYAEKFGASGKGESSVPRYAEQFGAPGKGEGLFNLPAGLCFNRDGNLVVCDDHNCRLQVFDPEGRFIETLGTTRGQKGLLCSPIGISMDFHGRYVITEFGSHCVTFLSPKGDILNCVRSVGPGYGQFVHPRGVTLDSAGYVYIADNENMRIARF